MASEPGQSGNQGSWPRGKDPEKERGALSPLVPSEQKKEADKKRGSAWLERNCPRMITCVIGFTGQGKSTLAYYVAQRATTRVIFDPRGQYYTTADVLPDSGGLYELLDDRYEIIVRPGRGEEVEENFDHTCRVVADWIEDNPHESICLLVDETRLVGLESKSGSLHFDWIVRSAREGSPIDVLLTCHRPVDVSTNLRAIANRLVFFRVMLPNDLAAIEEQCGPVVSREVNLLLDKQFVTWNNSRQQWRKVTDPSGWYIRIDGNPGSNT